MGNDSALLAVDLGAAYMALHLGDFARFLEIHTTTGIEPDVEKVAAFGRSAILAGNFEEGMAAYGYIRSEPYPEDIRICLAAAAKNGDLDVFRKAAAWLASKQ